MEQLYLSAGACCGAFSAKPLAQLLHRLLTRSSVKYWTIRWRSADEVKRAQVVVPCRGQRCVRGTYVRLKSVALPYPFGGGQKTTYKTSWSLPPHEDRSSGICSEFI